MARADSTDTLDKRADVVAAVDLPRVPAGTTGKVALVHGLSWVRYWVRFDNGVAVGSVNRSKLATPAEWKRRAEGGDEEAVGAGAEAATDDGTAGAGDDGGGVTVNGVMVPAKLIERSKAARDRLGA
ncbi:MAG: hypothetical protein M3507_09670 [Actinomycetota bacterium]|nr:hypothetical protein [Actinomycetota bacterium]